MLIRINGNVNFVALKLTPANKLYIFVSIAVMLFAKSALNPTFSKILIIKIETSLIKALFIK